MTTYASTIAYINRRMASLRSVIKDRGLSHDVFAFVGHTGEPFKLIVEAYQGAQFGEKIWTKRQSFAHDDPATALDQAAAFVYALPSKEQRNLEQLIESLNKTAYVAETCSPDAGSKELQAAWDAVAKELRDLSQQISHNGLPTPDAFGRSSDPDGDNIVSLADRS